MNGWITPKKLSHLGVLGMNRRNVAYIGRYNARHRFPMVDDKLKTKLIAHKAGLQVPELLHVVSTQHQVQGVERELSQISQFVIKPAQGSGGKGILIIQDQADGEFIKSNGERVTLAAVKRHLSNIISGLYSLGGRSDVAIVESLVKVTPLFSNVSHEGVPDIRLIVFQGYPVMGMLRLATKASDGKANLHQGAVGVGLDIGTGQSIAAVQDNRVISVHPDTGADLARLAVPNWQQLLLLAARCFDVTQLGYLGCDIVLDEHRGPLLLEMNARPGLSIQIANDEGLLPRLEHVEALDTFARSVEDRVAYAMQAFTRMSTVEQTSLWEES